jgi:hypothetical protein
MLLHSLLVSATVSDTDFGREYYIDDFDHYAIFSDLIFSYTTVITAISSI